MGNLEITEHTVLSIDLSDTENDFQVYNTNGFKLTVKNIIV